MKQNHEERINELEEEKRILQEKLKAEEEERKLRDDIKEIKGKEFQAKHGDKLKTLKRVGKNIKEDLVSAGKGLAKAGKSFSKYYYRDEGKTKKKSMFEPSDKDKPKEKERSMFEPTEDWAVLKKDKN